MTFKNEIKTGHKLV